LSEYYDPLERTGWDWAMFFTRWFIQVFVRVYSPMIGFVGINFVSDISGHCALEIQDEYENYELEC